MVSFIASEIFKMFTVHKKLSVAHTGDFNHINYTLKQCFYFNPHSASVKKKKIK